jgi:hypothetical protein
LSAEEAAQELWNAVDHFGKETAVATNAPPRMRVLPSGRAIICFREDSWTDGKTTNRWDEVFEELDQNQEALKQVRRLLQKPVFQTILDYEPGPMILLPHLSKAKKLKAKVLAILSRGVVRDARIESQQPTEQESFFEPNQ